MSPPWMPLYIADYRADTAHLSAAQHGAYLLLIMHYWQTGGLPDDDEQLARIACMLPAEWKKARATIAKFFDDKWKHARIDAELAKAEEKHSRRVRAGRSGGKAKASSQHCSSNATSNATSNALASSSQPERKSSVVADAPTDALPASQPVQVYPVDPTERLWAEGIDHLIALGSADRQARSCIGRALKASGNDSGRVLDAIRRARDMGSKDPISLIFRLLNPSAAGNRHDHRPTVQDAANALAERLQATERGEPLYRIGGG